MITPSNAIKRVVTVFILSQNRQRVAVLKRQDTMPTFPSHFAGVSGSIEPNETPAEAAKRELDEETNLSPHVELTRGGGGLFLDVSSDNAFGGRTIRVYPFVVQMPFDEQRLELRGTEHSMYEFITITELEKLQLTAVPGLARAFHHATYGKYLDLPKEIREWESDRINGAATLAQRAVELARRYPKHARDMELLRGGMVPIVNVLEKYIAERDGGGGGGEGEEAELSADVFMESLQNEARRSVQLGVDAICQIRHKKTEKKELVIATFSRSSTIKAILEQIQKEDDSVEIICGRSTPGNEGELMAKDLPHASVMDDEKLDYFIRAGHVDIFVVGSDCVMEDAIVNKVGTKSLAQAAIINKDNADTEVLCCADRWKIWTDSFPPPLEEIFEVVPSSLFDQILVPRKLENEDAKTCSISV